jgi:hypothetical protein
MKSLCAAISCCAMLAACYAAPRVSTNDPLPEVVQTCGGNIIKQIGPRLAGGSDFSSGFHVLLVNGGVTIDYVTPPAVRHSKVGDHVLACLIDIPKDCPPGDVRGRIYTITNLRTLESWTGADSQHRCGGA